MSLTGALRYCTIFPMYSSLYKDTHRTPRMSKQNLLASIGKGASYLVGLQLFTRLLTFALNQALLRFLSPSVLGLASIQLELLSSTVLFLSREAIRCALLRTNLLTIVPSTTIGQDIPLETRSTPSPPPYATVARSKRASKSQRTMKSSQVEDPSQEVTPLRRSSRRSRSSSLSTSISTSQLDPSLPPAMDPRSPRTAHIERIDRLASSEETHQLLSNYRKVVNVAHLPILFGGIFACVGFWFYTQYSWLRRPWLHSAVLVTCLASLVELAAEPLYILAQNFLFYEARVAAEAMGILVRCIVCFALTVVWSKEGTDTQTQEAVGVSAFAFAQLAYSLVLLLGYYRFFARVIWRNQIRHQRKQGEFWRKLWRLEHPPPENAILSMVDDKRIVFLQSWYDILPWRLPGQRYLNILDAYMFLTVACS